MAKNLVIVESPSKAKTIKKILGANYEVLASFGHVIDLPKTKIGIDIENGFEPQYLVIKEKKKILDELKSKAKISNKVFLASDLDREGEAIAWHISNYIKEKDKTKRIEFNEITKSAITKAIKSPRDINEFLVNAQQARRLLDRIVGYKISPLLWPNVGKEASAGRVQSVALKLVCDLENEIINFESKKYYEINIRMLNSVILSLNKIGSNKIDKIFDYNLYEKCLKDIENEKINILSVKNTKKQQRPPYVLKTSTMQQLASTYLGFSSSKTMKVAQKLYEGLDISGDIKGLITYMRTDSIRVSDEAKFQAKEFITLKYGKEYVGNYFVSKVNKNIQDAHEGIRPTDINLTPEILKPHLTNDEYKLYKLIWDRFLVSQFAPVKYEQLQIMGNIKEYEFKGTINKVIFDGYYKIFKDEDSIITSTFPEIKENSSYDVEEILKKEGETKAPTRYSEATLIKKLESLGIGRPSTYASIIDAIKSKSYVEIFEKRLIPTTFGKEVKNELETNFKNIMNVKFTALMEDKLDDVAKGNLNWNNLLKDFYNDLELEINKYKNKSKELKNKVIKTDVPCTNLNGNMVLKSGNFGKYIVCELDNNDKISIKNIEISPEEIEKGYVEINEKVQKMLETKKGMKTDVFTDSGSRYILKVGRFGEYLESEDYDKDNQRISLPKEIKMKIKKNQIEIKESIIQINNILKSLKEDENKLLENNSNCDKCGSHLVVKSGRYGKFLACSSYPNCKNIIKIKKSKK